MGGNNIEDIELLGKSSNLLELAIWDNPIVNIAPLHGLKKLRKLYCQNIGLHDISFIKELDSLVEVVLSNNLIRDISVLATFEFKNDIKFKKRIAVKDKANKEDNFKRTNILLDMNLIQEVPRNVAEKFNWLETAVSNRSWFSLMKNPLKFPPASVIELGVETTRNYYEASEQFGRVSLSEGRIIFIGDGASGKSSTIERILYNTFQKGREQTNGVKIEHMQLHHPEDGRRLTFHIWDFGGQEIQHAVHKFFFTEGCLYVLVLDNRKEEEPEYWLQQIESLGGKAPVIVVFNKHDENAAETADRKFLREKYPNILGFYNTSCQTGFGINDLKRDIERYAIKLPTVEEQFPNNWIEIKKAIEERTTGAQHYLTYEKYLEICSKNRVTNEDPQKLLLRYFNTIGAVTWFGNDTFLKFLHVLNPSWITQGVYKILTAKKTAALFGKININDFREMLQPQNEADYTYDEAHYGYILSMMKKFDLCDTPNDIDLLIPSAFGKEPMIEYSEFKGEDVRTYILQFKEYMPLALIHRYIAKNLSQAFENNYWYTGIVIKDIKSNSMAMIHADKEAKRIYVRVKGDSKLAMWEHFRRDFGGIAESYAKISYDELVALDENIENYVNYNDLISHVQARKEVYFHPKLRKDYNVGYLIGFFEHKEETLNKFKKGVISIDEMEYNKTNKLPSFVVNILNNNSSSINNQVTVNFSIINELCVDLKGDSQYLLDEIGKSNKELIKSLEKIIEFSDNIKTVSNPDEIKEKGWGRKLKNIIQTLAASGKSLKDIKDGGETLRNIYEKLYKLAHEFNLSDIIEILKHYLPK